MIEYKKFNHILWIILIIGVSFFGVQRTNAYFSLEDSLTTSFTTAIYNNLQLSTDKNTYGLCNQNATILLTVTNTNTYNVGYNITFSNSDLTYTIDGVAATTYTLSGSSSKTHTVVVSGATQTSALTITVTPNNPYGSSHTKVLSFDLICPSCTWSSNSANQYLTGGTPTTYIIDCLDENGIVSADLTTSSFSVSNTSLASISDVTKSNITSGNKTGYRYAVSVLGQNANGTITLTLDANSVKDSNLNDNVATTSGSITIDSTPPTVSYNLATGIYDEVKTIIVTPNDTGGSELDYYNLLVYKDGSEVTVKSQSNLTTATHQLTLDSDGEWLVCTYVIDNATNVLTQTGTNSEFYYCQTYIIDTTPPTLGSVARKYGSASGEAYEGAWTNQNVYIEAVDGSDSISGHKSTKFKVGSLVNTTDEVLINIGGRDYFKKNNEEAYVGIITFVGTETWRIPVLISDVSANAAKYYTTYLPEDSSEVSTITYGGKTYYYSTSLYPMEASKSYATKYPFYGAHTTYAEGVNAMLASITTLNNSTTITIEGEYDIIVVTEDNAGNTSEGTLTDQVKIDKTSPIIAFATNGNTTYAKSQSTIVDVEDAITAVATSKYLWTQTNGASAENGTDFTSGEEIVKSTDSGDWYLCVYATDTLGNYSNICSNVFKLDNEAPVITPDEASICLKKGSTASLVDFVSITDGYSGANYSTLSIKIGSTAVTNLSDKAVGNYTVTYNISDALGNVATQKSIIFRIYTKILGDVSIVTSGNGLYRDAQDASRYIYRGASPNNYVTFNGQTWRILSIEPDGTYKIIYNGVYTNAKYDDDSAGLLTYTATNIRATLNTTFYNGMTATAKTQVTAHNFDAGRVTYWSDTPNNTIAQTITQEKATPVSQTVALPIITDYLRASTSCTDATKWSTIQESYTCKNNNWMYISSTTYWVMNPYSATRARYQNTNGAVSVYLSNENRGVRPVVYLKATTTFAGNGTSSAPYTINTLCQESDVSSTTCSIAASPVSPDTTLPAAKVLLTINPSATSGITYSWNNTDWPSGSRTKTILSAGLYRGYIQDSLGKGNSCAVTIVSVDQYKQRDCSVTVTYGAWTIYSTTYVASTACTSNESETYRRTCGETYKATGTLTSLAYGTTQTFTSIGSTYAEVNTYCNNLDEQYSSPQWASYTFNCKIETGKKIYYRTCNCSSWPAWPENGPWINGTQTATCSREVQTRTAFNVVQ